MTDEEYRDEMRRLLGDSLITEEEEKMLQRRVASGELTVVSCDDFRRKRHPYVSLKQSQNDLKKLLNK